MFDALVDSDTGTANQAVYAMDSSMVWTEMAQLPWARFKLVIVKWLSLEEQRLHWEVQTALLKTSTFGTSKRTSGDLVLSKCSILPIYVYTILLEPNHPLL